MRRRDLSEAVIVNRLRKVTDNEFADRNAEKLHLLYPSIQACLGRCRAWASYGGALASDTGGMRHGKECSLNEVGLR